MSNADKERRCKKCGKRLIDEALPFCDRCVLNGRNTAGKMIGGATTVALAVMSAIAYTNNGSGDNKA